MDDGIIILLFIISIFIVSILFLRNDNKKPHLDVINTIKHNKQNQSQQERAQDASLAKEYNDNVNTRQKPTQDNPFYIEIDRYNKIFDILYKLTYDEYVNQLKEKYGDVPEDYFRIATKGKSKGQLVKNGHIMRGKDGLYVHHVYECYFLDLSDPTTYLLQRNDIQDIKIKDAQKAENLVYCNLLEHLILHIKIALEYRGSRRTRFSLITRDLNDLCELGDQNLIESVLNEPSKRWRQVVYSLIKDDYDIYVMLVNIIVYTLGISKDLICDGYYTCYQKLYEDLDRRIVAKQ